MPNYANNAATATRLIKEAGRLMAVKRKDSDEDYDPVAGASTDPKADLTWNINAVVLPATLARFRGVDNKMAESGNLVLQKARFLLVSAVNQDGEIVPEPLPSDIVSFDDLEWGVVGASPLSPAGIPILYQVGVVLQDATATEEEEEP